VQSRIVHGRNTLRVIPRAIVGISVSRFAVHLVAISSKRAVDRNVLLLLRGRRDQALATLLGPSIDEVAVRAVGITTGELEWRDASPAFGEDGAQVVADGEAQLGHGFHAAGAGAVAAGGAGFVGCFEGGGVDACGGEGQRE
jgi:hypothetical protein